MVADSLCAAKADKKSVKDTQRPELQRLERGESLNSNKSNLGEIHVAFFLRLPRKNEIMAFSTDCPYRRRASYCALCVIVVCVCAGLSSCSRDGADKTYHIAVIPKGTTHVFWKSVQAGARQAEADLNAQGKNVKITWQGPLKEDDREKQTELIESFIGMDGIVVAPLDSHAMKGPVDRAMAAGTLVTALVAFATLASESHGLSPFNAFPSRSVRMVSFGLSRSASSVSCGT